MKRCAKFLSVGFLGMFLLMPFNAQAQEGKKAIFIIAAKNFQDDEYVDPMMVLEDSGVSVTVASTTTEEVTGTDGLTAIPDVLISEVKAEDYDAIVFIGGSGAAQYLDDPAAHKLAQDAVTKNKVLGAICLAPRILTNAGVLKGKKATVYPSEQEKLKEAGVNYTGKPVEQDGKIITADGPSSAEDFGRRIVSSLK